MLERVLEPEVMDTQQEVDEYVTFDHSEVNEVFVDQVLALAPKSGRVLDIGSGPGDIAILLAKKAPELTVYAVDLSDRMLDFARENVARHGLGERVVLKRADAKATGFSDGEFDMVISNSMIHHIPEPQALFAEVNRVARPGAALYLKDLHRPSDAQEHEALVKYYATDCTDYQRKAFSDSLRAGLTVEEVVEICGRVQLQGVGIKRCSDRHWCLARRASPVV